VLRPERHVIEAARPPHCRSCIINGVDFTAKSAACSSWDAGEQRVDAVFRNAARRSACSMWCGTMWCG
jgi:hypothetical protein